MIAPKLTHPMSRCRRRNRRVTMTIGLPPTIGRCEKCWGGVESVVIMLQSVEWRGAVALPRAL
jgi:hypothetical protein